MKYPIWKTKDGIKIPINLMDDNHLQNCLNLMRRRAEVEQAETIGNIGSVMGMLQGEMATYYAEQDFDRACESTWDDYVPDIYWEMQSLLESRRQNRPDTAESVNNQRK
jgi:hypothetical protein